MSVSDDCYIYFYDNPNIDVQDANNGTKTYLYASSSNDNFLGTTDVNNATVFNFKQNSSIANNYWYLTMPTAVYGGRTLVRFNGNVFQETESTSNINTMQAASIGDGTQLQGSIDYSAGGTQVEVTSTVMPSTSDTLFTVYIISNYANSRLFTEFIDSTAPTMSSIALNTINTNLIITFSESVYNTNGGSGDLETSDFSVQLSGGNASSPSLTAISKTSQSVWDVSLSYTGTSNGSETLTIEPASSSIYDAAGNAASTSQSNNTTSLNPFPSISSSVLSSNNTTLTVTFSEGVYNTSGGSGDLETSDFTLALSGGVATSPTISNISKTSQLIWVLTISYTGDADGTETLTVNPASTTSIYNSVGNVASTSQSNNTATINDISNPSFSVVDLSSNNSIKTNYAGASDVISLNLTVSETINQPYVVFQSGGAAITNSPSYSGSGAQWTVSYTVSSSDTNGAVSFTIDASDNTGNTSQRTTTTNSTSVTKVGISSLVTTVTGTSGLQIGSDIDGEAIGVNSGYSVSMSSDGTIVAIGAPYANGNGNNSGHVRVYQRDTNEAIGWSQLGSDIDGEAANDYSGWSVSLSSDGTILAIGAVNNNSYIGHVRVYEYSNSSWSQLGGDIDGEHSPENSGYSVSLSSDGTILAIGAPYNDGNGNESGHVRVYERDTNEAIGWKQLGSDIDGEYAGDISGYSVSLNSDGTIVAIGARLNDGNGGQSGHVRIFERDTNEAIGWKQLGSDIDGEDSSDELGYSVSLNSDGTILAIGAPFNDGDIVYGYQAGHVRVYQYINGSWSQLGDDINGEATSDRSGWSVSLSGDGTILAIGAYWNDGNSGSSTDNRGHVRLYQYSGSSWSQLGSDIDGEVGGDRSGYSVSLSSDGTIVAIGAPYNSGNGVSSGHVRIFETGATGTTTTTINAVPPDLTALTIASNNADTTLAKASDTVTLSLTYDMSINTPIIDISSGGAAIADTTITYATVNGSNLNWTATYTVDSADTDGTVTFAIDASSTETATTATEITQSDITSGSNVTIDNTAPTFSSTVLSSDNTNVTITFSESVYNATGGSGDIEISDFTVSITGGAATNPSFTAITKNSQSVYDLSLSFSNTADGTETLTINPASATSIYDAASNAASTSQSNNTVSLIDSLTPSLTFVDLSSNNSIKTNYAGADDVISLNLTASETINQPYVVFQSGGALITNSPSYSGSGTQWNVSYTVSSSDTDGAVSFTIDVSDNAGNTSQRTTTTNSTSVTKVGISSLVTTTSTTSGTPIGNNIVGQAENERLGSSVSMSSDGTIVAIGAPYSNVNGNFSGHVSLYQYSDSSWNQLGADIHGEAANNYSGYSVSLNSDTSSNIIVAIGAYGNDANGNDSGHVRVYQYDATKETAVTTQSSANFGPIGWNRLGADIDGVTASERSGFSVSLSSDGSIVAIAAYYSNGQTGHVSLYEYSSSDVSWNQLGSDIDGEAGTDYFGWNVSLSSNGTIVAIGAIGNNGYTGHVRVYEYSSSDVSWNQLGSDIDGEAANDRFGHSVSLNSDGTIVAIGGYFNDGDDSNNSMRGHVRVFEYSSSDVSWNQLGSDIDGEAEYDRSGHSVSLSSDGTILAIGSPYNDGDSGSTTDSRGHVRVYQYSSSDVSWNQLGSDIDGEASGDQSGYSISLSSDGSIVAIGAIGSNSNTGHVRILETGTTTTTTTTINAVPPDLTALTIASNNANTTLAKASDNVTLSLTYDMSINTPIIDISSGGAAIADTTITYATVNDSSLNWTAVYTVDSADTDGTVTFAIDASSTETVTSATEITQSDITSGSNVTIDTTVPTLTVVDLSSNHNTSTLAKENDVITLNVTASEPVNTPIITMNIGGSAVSNSAVSGSGNTFATTYTVGSSDNGSVTFTIDASDNAGNNATQVTATTNSSAITVDTTAATFSSTALSSNNSNVTITFSESVYNTATYSSSTLTYTVTANGISNYILNGSGLTDSAQPALNLHVGQTVTFSVASSVNFSHPFKIGTSSNGGEITTSDSRLSSSGSDPILISFTPDTNGTFYYYCSSHNGMGNSIAVIGDLETTDFTPSLSGGTATSPSFTAIAKVSQSVYDLSLSISGIPDGAETLTIVPASTTSIYDATGNASSTTQSNNTASVNDNTIPTFTLVDLSSNNATSTLAKEGDIITINVTASETITTPTIAMNIGESAVSNSAVSGSGTTYTTTYTVGSSDSGSVTFTLDASDTAGNNATQVTATTNSSAVTVDTTVPTLTVVDLSSNNTTSTLAKENDVITLNITASETINTPIVAVSVGGSPVSNSAVSGSGSTYTTTYTIGSSDNGSVTFTIDASDNAGNSANQVTATTNGSAITVDTTVPTLTVVDLSSNNTTSTLAKENDVITLNITASETINTPIVAVSVGGSPVSNSAVSGSGNTFATTYTIGSSDSGSVTFTIDASDNAGNSANQVTATTNGSAITVDTTAPTFTLVDLSSNNATSTLAKENDVITLNITSSETINTPIVAVSVGGSPVSNSAVSGSGSTYTTTYTIGSSDSGSVTFTLDASDNAGNSANQVTATTNGSAITVDTTAPTFTLVDLSSNNATSTLAKEGDIITINVTASETITTPTIAMIIGGSAVSNSAVSGSGTTYTTTYTIGSSDNGSVTFTLDASDTAGNNANQVTTTTNGSAITVDTTVPTLTLVDLSSNNTTSTLAKENDVITLNISASETINTPIVAVSIGGSPVSNTAVSGSGNTFATTYTVGSSDSGTVTFTIDASDNAGNSATQVTATTNGSAITVDTTAPTFTLVDLSSNNATSTLAKEGDIITINVTASEAIGTPTIAMIIGGSAVSNSAVSGSGTTYTTTYTIGSSDSGSVTFTLDASDTAGNNATQVTATTNSSAVTVDTTVPTLTVVDLSSNNTTSTLAKENDVITLNITASETINTPIVAVSVGGSPVSNTAVSGSGNTFATTYTVGSSDSGTVTFTIDASDNAGNSATQVTATTNGSAITVDTAVPTISSVSLSSNNLNITVNFSENVYNSSSGSGDLTADDFVFALTGGTATLASTTPSAINKISQSIYDLSINVSGSANSAEQLTVNPASSAIFDQTGNTASTSQSNNQVTFSDTTAPTITNTNLFSNEAIRITFNENVYNTNSGGELEASDFQLSIANGTAVLNSNTPSAIGKVSQSIYDLSISYTGSSVANSLEELTVNPVSASIFDLAGNAATTSQSNNMVNLTDTTSPTITAITTTTSDGSYNLNTVIPITVTFIEPITISTSGGTPTLTLNIGGTGVNVDYSNTSGNSAIIFNYTVENGHNEPKLDYENTTSLALNGATITDIAGNNATLTLPTPGQSGSLSSSSEITIDTTQPSISNITSSTADGSYKEGVVIPIQVVFTEPVTVTTTGGTPDISLNIGGTLYDILYSRGTGTNTLEFDYTIQAGHNDSNNLDYNTTSSLGLNGGTIKDNAGNDAGLTLPSPGQTGSLSVNKNLIIDTTNPTITNINSSTSNGEYKANVVIPIQVTFSEIVYVDTTNGTPDISLNIGGSNYGVTYSSGTASTVLTFNYTILQGQDSSSKTDYLDYAATTSLGTNEGTIRDSAGNNATLTLPSPGSTNSLSSNKNLIVDTTSPTVNSFVMSDTALKAGDTATVTLEFSEAVSNFSSDDDITVVNGSLSTMTTSDNITWTGTYTPNSNVEDSSNILSLSSNYTDVAGNTGTASQTANFTIDTIYPTVVSFTMSDTALKIGDTATVSLQFSEAVSNFSSDDDITATNGSLSTMTTSDNITWTGTYTPNTEIEDTTNVLSLSTNYTDTAGNIGPSQNTSNFAIDTSQNIVIAFTISDSTLTIGETATVTLQFDEAVSGFNSNDDITVVNGSLSTMTTGDNITWSGTYTPSQNVEDTTNILSLNNSYTDTAGNTGISANTSNFIIDTFASTVTSVTSVTTDDSYKENENISIQINLREAVNVDTTNGTPKLTLNVGGTDVSANYSSGTGTNTLNFTYTIQSGHNESDLNYKDINSLDVDGGTIKDTYGNDLSLNLPATNLSSSLAGSSSIVIDTSSSTIMSSSITTNNQTITVVFDEDVYSTENGSGNLETTDFSLSMTTGTQSGTASLTSSNPSSVNISGNNTTWLLGVPLTGSPDGTEVITITPVSSSIYDKAGNITSTTQTNNQVTVVDALKPTLSTVSITTSNSESLNTDNADIKTKVGDVITLTMQTTNNENVTTPTVVFKSNGDDITDSVTYTGTSPGPSHTAQYTIDSNDSEGIITFTISNFIDTDNNTGLDVTTLSNSTVSQITVDKTLPTLTNVELSSSNSNQRVDNGKLLAKEGDTVTIDISSSEIITTPTIAFSSNGNASNHSTVSMTQGSTRQSYSANFTVASNHTEGDVGFTISSFTDIPGNSGSSVTSTTDNSYVEIDLTGPTFSSLTLSSNNNTSTLAKEGNIVTLSMVAAEAITQPSVAFTSGDQSSSSGTVVKDSDTEYRAFYTVQNSDTDGGVGYTITSYTDTVGNNPPSTVTALASASNITVDKQTPSITTTTVNSSNNFITITFDENVFNTSTGSGALEVSDFVLSIDNSGGGVATLSNTTPGSITVISNYNKYMFGFTVSGNPNGNERISIAPLTDAVFDTAGNAALTTGHSNFVSLNDVASPSFSTITIASNNSNTTLAKSGDTVTLSLTADEPVTPPTVAFTSNGSSVNGAVTVSPSSGTNTNYTATYAIAQSDGNGAVGFTVSGFQDSNSNSGNTATSTTNSSAVTVDTQAPSLSVVTLTTNNSGDQSLAKAGETVTLTITSSENINTPTVTFNTTGSNVAMTGSVDVTGSGQNYTATIGVNSGDTDGTLNFVISNISDTTGNTASNVTSVTNGSSVTIDKTAPTLSTVTIASNNSTTTLAKPGDVITLTIVASENITQPTVAFTSGTSSVNGSVSVGGSGNSYTASYTVDTNDTNGSIAFTISNFLDTVGNSGVQVNTLTSGSTVTVDNTIPTLTAVSISSNNANSSSIAKTGDVITVSITSSENITSPTVSFTSGGVSVNNAVSVSGSNQSYAASYQINSSDTNGQIGFTISNFNDLTGNAGAGVTNVTDSTSVTVDLISPSVQSIVMNPILINVKSTSTATITFTEAVYNFSNDDITVQSGTISTVTTSDNITWQTVFTPDSNFSNASNVSIITIGTNYIDLAGNQALTSAQAMSNLSSVVNSNDTANIITNNISGATLDSPVINNSPGDGIDNSIIYTVSNKDLTDVDSATQTTISNELKSHFATQLSIDSNRISITLAQGSVVISVFIASSDEVNTSSTSFTVDTTVPTVTSFTMNKNTLKVGETATFNVVFSEEVVGFEAVDIDASGGVVSLTQDSTTEYSGVYTPNTNTEIGVGTLTITEGSYVDTGGNVGSTASTSNYAVDTQAPSGTFTTDTNKITSGQTATITLTFSEEISGFDSNTDVTVSNGTLSQMTNDSGDNRTFVGTFTPGTTTGTTNFTLVSESYVDSFSNVGQGSNFGLSTDTSTDRGLICKPKNINNNELEGVKSMPLKDSTSSNDSSFSLGRKSYSSRMQFTNYTTSQRIEKGWSFGKDASSVIARRKAASMGSSLNINGGTMSFTNNNDTNVRNRALQRARSGGAVVPKKSNK